MNSARIHVGEVRTNFADLADLAVSPTRRFHRPSGFSEGTVSARCPKPNYSRVLPATPPPLNARAYRVEAHLERGARGRDMGRTSGRLRVETGAEKIEDTTHSHAESTLPKN